MAAKSGALLLTDDAIFPVRAGLSAMKNLGSEIVLEHDDVVVITQCGTLGNLCFLCLLCRLQSFKVPLFLSFNGEIDGHYE